MDKILKSLGISTERQSLLNNDKPFQIEKSGGYSGDNIRMGRPGNARDVLEYGIQKGSFGSENLKNTHGEDWHSDNDKEVEQMVTTIDEVPQHEDGEHPKKARNKDRYNRTIQEVNIEEYLKSLTQEELFLKAFDDDEGDLGQKTDKQVDNEADEAAQADDEDEDEDKDEDEEKSLNSVLNDLTKGFDFNKDKKIDSHEKHHKKLDEDHKKMEKKSELDEVFDLLKGCDPKKKKMPDIAQLHENSDKVREISAKKSFIKAIGPGGILFNFGGMTGNPVADRHTAIISSQYDPQQNQIAQDQQAQTEKAITSFITKGSHQWANEQGNGDGVNPQSDWNSQLNTPMDKQVENAFGKGQLTEGSADSTPGFFDRNKFASEQMTLGGEVIKATSETDQQLIQEMKKAGLDAVFEGGVEVNTTSSGGVVFDMSTGIAYGSDGQMIESTNPAFQAPVGNAPAPAEVLTAANF